MVVTISGQVARLRIDYLILCLVKPMRRGERAIPQENLVAVLLDNSQSMQLKPPGSSVDRLEKQKQVVADDEPWEGAFIAGL